MTPIEHLQSICPESAGWAVHYADSSAAIVKRGSWTIDLIGRFTNWHSVAQCGATTARCTNPNPTTAITNACAAVKDELRELIKGAP